MREAVDDLTNAYCVEGFVGRHLMPEYEVGKHTGGAPWHPHLAVHQHLAWGQRRQKGVSIWEASVPPNKKGTHPPQPGPRLWTERPLGNAGKCFAGARPAASAPCTWCRRVSSKPVWLQIVKPKVTQIETTWLVFTVPFLLPSAVLRTWVTPSRLR